MTSTPEGESFWSLSPDEERKIRSFLASCHIFLMDETIERAAIDPRRRTRRKRPDAIIAATALVPGLSLITMDARLEAALRSGAP